MDQQEIIMSYSRRLLISLTFACLAWTGWGFSTAALAEEDFSKILIAKPELQDALYGATILIARDMPDGSSMGFILNKPTRLTLGELFPDHMPSLKVPDPIFLGGPVGTNVVFALVGRRDSPGKNAMQVAPDLYVVVESDMVDRIIESESDHARFLVGMVMWRPGELQAEMKRGLWYEMKTEASLVLRKKTDGLWEELVNRSEAYADAI